MRPFFALLLAVLVCHFSPSAVGAQSLAERIDKTLAASPATERSRVAVFVKDLKTGEVIFARFEKQLFTPASVLKTYTSACALDTFGPDKRFETKIISRGKLVDGTLNGDLVVKAGGDAMFTHDDLAELAKKVKDAGITHVTGDVVVDASLFAPPLKGNGWMWDDDPDGYNMSVSAMMMDYNVLTATVRWSGAPKATPEVEFFPAMLKPYGVYTDAKPGDKTALDITRRPFSESFEVHGTTAKDAAETTKALTMHFPDEWVRQVLLKDLADAGVTVDSGDMMATWDKDTDVVSMQSKTLAEMITRLNKVSENAIAEMLIHHLSIQAGTKPGTWPAGADFITKWVKEKPGLGEGDFKLVDGSGLSRYDLVCAEGTVKLLEYMSKHKDFKVYEDSFPIYTATLKDGTKVKMIHAKPGGMAAVNTLAGYVEKKDGGLLGFAIFANGYIDEKPVVELRRKLLAEMAE